MKIDKVAHQAAVKAESERFAMPDPGWEYIRVGQHLHIVNNEVKIEFDWLEWLNFHVDRLIRPIHFGLAESVYNANPEYWNEVFQHGRYLPAWAVSWLMWLKYGRDSLL